MIKALTSRWALAPLALGALLAWLALLSLPDDRVRITFLDVGQGDAILIRAPSYKVLIDGGPSPQAIARHLGQRLPFWDRSIDLVVLTHPHDDHLMGLVEVVKRYQVKGILATPYVHDSALFSQWLALVQEKGIPYTLARDGQEIALGQKARMQVLHPGANPWQTSDSDANNNSVVLRVTAGSFSALLPGDVEAPGQWALMGRQEELSSLVLKVPHQGARNALVEGFLEQVRPQIAVISVGEGNPFGHPAPETLSKLQGTQVFRTDQDGTVEVETDGQRYWARGERRRDARKGPGPGEDS